ncbi:MAG: hypothetical protein KDC56_07275, partial [Flavobacteriaceae bacterium]|nr:hypothetical protein [Flavobacteriaceae bacterium]
MKIQKFIALLVITVFTFSCQDEAVYDMNNDVQLSLDLKKGSTANNTFMVISKSETLPPDLMKEIVSYGEVTKTIP